MSTFSFFTAMNPSNRAFLWCVCVSVCLQSGRSGRLAKLSHHVASNVTVYSSLGPHPSCDLIGSLPIIQDMMPFSFPWVSVPVSLDS